MVYAPCNSLVCSSLSSIGINKVKANFMEIAESKRIDSEGGQGSLAEAEMSYQNLMLSQLFRQGGISLAF